MARCEEYTREMAYRFYIADTLQLSVQKKYLTKSLRDIIYQKPEDIRSGDEIAIEIMQKAGLKFEDK